MRGISLIAGALVVAMLCMSSGIGLSIKSKAFSNNGMIPTKYSCEDKDVNPPLTISNIPERAQTLAIILHDPDAPRAGGFTHWVIWNIDTRGNIPENYKGGDQGFNGAEKNGYVGMCPPSGKHHYHFKVYALDTRLDIDKNTDKAGLEKAMQGHIVSEGELVGLYEKVK